MFNRVKKIIKDFRGDNRLHLRMNPERDWKVLLVLFSSIVIFAFLFDYIFLLFLSSSMDEPVASDSLMSPLISGSKLSGVLKLWSEKETRFNDLLKSKPEKLIDPSI